jgi:alkylhydroperoxidase family enzyme
MQMDTFLSPIEKPQDPMMRLAYAAAKRQFGKVLTSLKVFSARLPLAFAMFYSRIGKLDKKLQLAPETQMLIRERVERLNVCLFCIDIGRSIAIKTSMDEAKFDALDSYDTRARLRDRVDARQEGKSRHVRADGLFLFRTRDLRDRLARRHRTPLQRHQHRPEYSFRYAVRSAPKQEDPARETLTRVIQLNYNAE